MSHEEQEHRVRKVFAEAQRILKGVLAEAIAPGFFGTVGVTLTIQNGKVQAVKSEKVQTHKPPE